MNATSTNSSPKTILDLRLIRTGLPGISPSWAEHLYEGCVVSMGKYNHNHAGTQLTLLGKSAKTYELIWDGTPVTHQILRSWRDQQEATEKGAVCIAVILALHFTSFKVIERSAKGTGIDYWLGADNDLLFQHKARLEVSGIFKGKSTHVNSRYKVKHSQTSASKSTGLPAFIGIVEFSNPLAKFGI